MGLADDNQQLRKLSRAVMRGELGRRDYQQQRRLIINAHTGDADDDSDLTDPGASAVPVVDTTAPTLAVANVDTRIATTGTQPPLALPPAAATAQGNDVWLGLGAVLIVLLVVAGALALFL